MAWVMQELLSLEMQILDALGMPILVKNQDGVYVYVNQKASEVMGLPKGQILGHTVYELAPAKQADSCTKDDLELFANGGEQIQTLFVQTNNNAGVARIDRKLIVSKEGTFIVEAVWVISKIDNDELEKLSDREIEVLMLVREGRPTKQIAQALDLSPYTINDHLKSIYKKLDVNNKSQALKKVLGSEVFATP